MNKNILKEGYYYECKPWYDTLPDEIAETYYKTEIFPKAMTHKEILETYKIIPYNSYFDAAFICISALKDLKNDYKGRSVYFKENDVLYRFNAWRGDGGQLRVNVDEVDLDGEYDAGSGVLFSNGISDTSDLTLKPSETLSLRAENLAIDFCEKWADGKARAVIELRDKILELSLLK